MEMSFLGSNGHLMAGSGINDLFEMIYARKAVEQILSGKAISRAVRAHLLLDAVLNGLLLSKSKNVPLPCSAGVEQDEAKSPDKTPCTNSDLKAAESLYDVLVAMTKDAEEVANDEAIARIQAIRDGHVETLAKDPTASLWIQYLDTIRILRNFITAERLGNWYLHLETVSEMLPYLASSGHALYAKTANIYLSSMTNLPNDHPAVHQHFVEGLHVARRSDRAWAGLSTDLIIEQVLMRSMKTSGGLTRGRGMTEQQRLTLLLAMPACAEVNRAMQELSGAKYSTNEQNKETGKSRQRLDMKDTHTLLFTMSERNPFAESTSLRNIMTGVNATGDVDVCRAKEIGQKIMDSMSGIPVAQYTVKRSDQVTTLQSKSSVRVDGHPIHVDPELLFQSLIVASNANAIDDRKSIFRFELCSYPSALFDDTHMPRAPQKAVLANAIWTRLPPDIAGPTDDVEGCLPFERRQQT